MESPYLQWCLLAANKLLVAISLGLCVLFYCFFRVLRLGFRVLLFNFRLSILNFRVLLFSFRVLLFSFCVLKIIFRVLLFNFYLSIFSFRVLQINFGVLKMNFRVFFLCNYVSRSVQLYHKGHKEGTKFYKIIKKEFICVIIAH